MMRHMAYVISVKDHELLYGDWITMIFKLLEFLSSTRKVKNQRGTRENRRRDDEIEATDEDVHEEEVEDQNDFDWEAVIDEAAVQGESGSGEKIYDAEDEIQESTAVVEEVPAMAA
ncbi:hypothetical protein Dimus_001641 [Dionaea muscipula]